MGTPNITLRPTTRTKMLTRDGIHSPFGVYQQRVHIVNGLTCHFFLNEGDTASDTEKCRSDKYNN